MKALFLTTQTFDCFNHVQAWNSAFPRCEHVTFDHGGIRNDWQLVEAAEKSKPDIIFYIGACNAPGCPKPSGFRELRSIAPLVNVVSDAADTPWHPFLRNYHMQGCFDLQVGIDGVEVTNLDMVTLTPVDPAPFLPHGERTIRYGFSGHYGKHSERGHIIRSLQDFGNLTVREGGTRYEEHARFMRNCLIVVNVSYTGSGLSHHIKGRVLEAGWAGCALMESEGSPIADWFPEGAWIPYENPRHAAALMNELTDRQIEDAAHALSETVRERYTAEKIYGQMIAGAQRRVDPPQPIAAA